MQCLPGSASARGLRIVDIVVGHGSDDDGAGTGAALLQHHRRPRSRLGDVSVHRGRRHHRHRAVTIDGDHALR
ncbi:hypothetical protein PLANTIT3_61123 [Plantibacter sp. T3]|nr:hypothetical protein PLANTIT3_61123 [Plantibacter sp. T3]